MDTRIIVITFKSVDEILSLAVLSHGTICFARFEKLKFGTFLNFYFGYY